MGDEVKVPESMEVSLARWSQAACGRHANRYCEDDGGWDVTCHYCATNYAHLKQRDEVIAALQREIAALRVPVSELENISITISNSDKIIRAHRCTEYSAPEMDVGYGGNPPCKWSGKPNQEWCDSCKIANEAKKVRSMSKRRRSSILRKLSARASAQGEKGNGNG